MKYLNSTATFHTAKITNVARKEVERIVRLHVNLETNKVKLLPFGLPAWQVPIVWHYVGFVAGLERGVD